ncbi:MAG: D-alanyl-D-alanine carboxypeptidase [Desulfovibrionaceae bacterium]|nr:D-alanyl-D-alanine carboxypeptidase [Desulfovibrionaceae bacterium]
MDCKLCRVLSLWLSIFFCLFCSLSACASAKTSTNQTQETQENEITTEPQDNSEPETSLITDLQVVSAIMCDLDYDRILYEQNPDQLIQPASLTKIMTMYLALEQIQLGNLTYQTPVEISPKAANEGGSRMGIVSGETIEFGQLLRGMAISSGNDASLAVAEFLGGTNENFIELMNQKAKKLAMTNTHFCTPNGLPHPEQYTTARDMLILARAYLKRFPWALELFHNQRTLKHRSYVSWNKNPLLEQYPGCDGLKTGWVRASGYNMIFTAIRGRKRLLAVILGAPDPLRRGVEACRLLDAGFLVCARYEPSVEDALMQLPFANYKLNLAKSAHEAIAKYGYVSQGKRGRKINSIKRAKARARAEAKSTSGKERKRSAKHENRGKKRRKRG